MRDEFPTRNAVIRAMVVAAAGRRRVGPALQAVLNTEARAAARLGLARPASALLSAAYNLAYYRANRRRARRIRTVPPSDPPLGRRPGRTRPRAGHERDSRSGLVRRSGRPAARWYLRHADVVGPRVRVRGRPVVKNWGRMVIGDRTQLVSTIATLELVTMKGGTLEIGRRTLLNYGGSIAARERSRSVSAA